MPSTFEYQRKLISIEIKPHKPSFKIKFIRFIQRKSNQSNWSRFKSIVLILRTNLRSNQMTFICLLVTNTQKLYQYLLKSIQIKFIAHFFSLIYFRLKIDVYRFSPLIWIWPIERTDCSLLWNNIFSEVLLRDNLFNNWEPYHSRIAT